MSNTIKSVIKLRTDTISNWFSNRNKTLYNNELSIVKFDDGTIGIKLGKGSTYSLTDFIKFQSLAANSLTDGSVTLNFPSTGGIIATRDLLDLKANVVDLNSLAATLAAEVTARVNGDTNLQTQIDQLSLQTSLQFAEISLNEED